MKRAEMRQTLVDHYLDFFSVAMAIVQNEDDARDVVQEALTRTMTRLYIKSPCDYCVRTIRNLSLKVVQRRSQRVDLDEMMLVTDYEHERLLQLVAEKREELSEVAKAIVELHDEDGYTLSDVAGMMQMSPSTVKRILADAHYELRKKIEQEI